MEAVKQVYISVEDYFALEKTAECRHEYIDGEIFAMSGTSDFHNFITQNILIALRQRLRGSPCKVFMENVRLQVDEGVRYTYPDVMVTCDDRDLTDRYTKRYPVLIVEVLSDSTEADDRGKKASKYRRISTLQQYVLVSQSECSVELFSRTQTSNWMLTELSTPDSILNLSCLNLEIPLTEIYEAIEFS
ncbi:Uma2 family endonuclease [Kamptonema sp. UHCC 0994]|uniref:Uma2 family endonuclease n=1 Tax=Kamptonema sp. UHCC 0994 TaxID=3031329 RepID=UPI0023B9948B|nr:Uma2 family endonuclease [Kamptonema sp. UHCC 0994]MDF0554345.1 Uma2 family endonuclease [Kamptonema sp. UHCC 0994]